MVDFHRLVFLRTSNSTNDYAITSSNNDPNHNTCTYTFHQVAGRGQIGRTWYTGADKNVATTFSWNQPNVPIVEQFRINMAFSLAIWGFGAHYLGQDHLTIKWPNDIYYKDNKLAGILIQNILKGSVLESCHLGVGININELDFPVDLPNPISLRLISGQKYDLIELQHKLVQMVSNQLTKVNDNLQNLKTAYEALLYRKGTVAAYKVDDQVVSGIIRGTTPEGKLRLDLEDGEREFGFRELAFL